MITRFFKEDHTQLLELPELILAEVCDQVRIQDEFWFVVNRAWFLNLPPHGTHELFITLSKEIPE